MAQRNRGWVWVALVVLLLFLAWLGSYYGWWSLKQGWKGTNGGTNYGTSPSPSSGSNASLSNFYGDVQNGESKQQVTSSSRSNNLSQSCTLTLNTTTLKQELCVYRSGSAAGSVTVTYQNDRVTAVTKSGF